jgi:hypothetical protein
VDLLLTVVEGKAEQARGGLEALVQRSPDSEQVLRVMLVVLLSSHRHREALEVSRALLRARPEDEATVTAMVELKAATHWSTWPLRPFTRYGWGASMGFWLLSVLLINGLRKVLSPEAMAVFLGCYLAFIVYSWVYPPLLKRWLKARGF